MKQTTFVGPGTGPDGRAKLALTYTPEDGTIVVITNPIACMSVALTDEQADQLTAWLATRRTTKP